MSSRYLVGNGNIQAALAVLYTMDLFHLKARNVGPPQISSFQLTVETFEAEVGESVSW